MTGHHEHGKHIAHHHHHHHGHGGDHAHGAAAPAGSARRLLLAFGILAVFTLIEAAGGYLANSIALLAEAAHMLADCASLLLAIIALRVSERPADLRRTYGHRRYQPLAAFVNGEALLLLTCGVVYEAVLRLVHPPPVQGHLMLAVALLGAAANFAAFLALSGARSLNERGARAHVVSDLLGSGAASVAALLIIYRGWTLADPLLSLLVSILIARSAWRLIRESADVLLQSVPADFDVARIEAALVGQVPGLINVHHVHCWSMTGELPTVTLHAHLAAGTGHQATLAAIHARLKQQLRAEHITVQIEEEGSCEQPE
ncbi:MAG TPA: cation diffusion facilitator family transporter [Steroidobacteraceae bacterium]|nr:cation diffusion facilitator family transporter [Steroidobacteraceae bacterium]